MNTKKSMFKALLVCLCMMCCPAIVNAQSGNVDLSVGIIRKPSGPGIPRNPIEPPTASLEGYTFTIIGAHPDFLVRIVDVEDEDDVIYQTLMPAATSSIILPSTLSGDYQIQLIWDIWMFYGLITL